LSLVLLSTAGVVVRSFQQLLAANPGFKPEGVLTFGVGLGNWLFPKDPDSYAFEDRVDIAMRSLPGVTEVSATTTLPLAGGAQLVAAKFPGAPGNTGDTRRDIPLADRIFIRAGYVKTIGMRLAAGREFEEARHEGVLEALIDRELAKQFFPNGS